MSLTPSSGNLAWTCLVVDADAAGFDVLGDDGQHGRLLAGQGDRAVDGVLEEVAELRCASPPSRRSWPRSMRSSRTSFRACCSATIASSWFCGLPGHRRLGRLVRNASAICPRGSPSACSRSLPSPMKSPIPASARIGRRPKRREQLRLHDGPRHVQRLIQVHLERDRPAAHQGHAHVLPVLIGRVLDDGPALQDTAFSFLSSTSR